MASPTQPPTEPSPTPDSPCDLNATEDSLSAFLLQESKFYRCRDYLAIPCLDDAVIEDDPFPSLSLSPSLDQEEYDYLCGQQQQQQGPPEVPDLRIPNPLLFVAECASIVADFTVRDDCAIDMSALSTTAATVPSRSSLTSLPPETPTLSHSRARLTSPNCVALPTSGLNPQPNQKQAPSSVIRNLVNASSVSAPKSPSPPLRQNWSIASSHASPTCVADASLATAIPDVPARKRLSPVERRIRQQKYEQYCSYVRLVAVWREQMFGFGGPKRSGRSESWKS